MIDKNFYLIGGSKFFGSGKIIFFLKNNLNYSYENFNFIETQKSNIGIIKKLLKIKKNSKILFQPSISFPAFLRDILIVLFIRYKTNDLTFILCVDICFKNPILKFRIFRKIFFSNRTVISIASFSQRVEKQISIKPFFEKKNLTISTVNNTFLPLAALHLGYFTRMKGWYKFCDLVKSSTEPIQAFSIGSTKIKNSNLLSRNHKILYASNTKNIECSVDSISKKFFPCLIFLSNEDFAPLIVLEAGYWGIPIVCIRKTKGEQILSRFLPNNCFIVIDNLDQLFQVKEKLIISRKKMFNFIENFNERTFYKRVLEILD